MIDLIKEWFELFVKQNWLRIIDKEVDKYNRLNQKAKVQAHVVHKLVERYTEIYGEEIKVDAEALQDAISFAEDALNAVRGLED